MPLSTQLWIQPQSLFFPQSHWPSVTCSCSNRPTAAHFMFLDSKGQDKILGRTVPEILSNYLPFISSSMQFALIRIVPRCMRSAVRALRTCDWGPAVVGWRFPPNGHHVRLGIGRSGNEMRLARWPRWHWNMWLCCQYEHLDRRGRRTVHMQAVHSRPAKERQSVGPISN
jgi:hypothetical protein